MTPPDDQAPSAVRLPLALGTMAACVASVALYALLRVAQFYLFPEPNPATVIWSAHAGYFWRAWSVAYGGGMAGFFAYAAARRKPEQVARVLLLALTGASALILLQGLLVP